MTNKVIVENPTPRDEAFCAILEEINDDKFARRALDFVDDNESVIIAASSKAVNMFGGQLPSTWTFSDLHMNARIEMYWVIDEARKSPKSIRLTNGVDSYLVQWTAAKLSRRMEQDLPEGVSQSNRNRTSIFKACAELSTRTGRDVTVDEAIAFVNRNRSIVRGIRPAVREHRIVRTQDLPHLSAGQRSIRQTFVESIVPGGYALDDLGEKERENLVVDYNKKIIDSFGFDQVLADGGLARVTDLLPETVASSKLWADESRHNTIILRKIAATKAGTKPEDHVAAVNAEAIIECGMSAMRTSGSLVSADDIDASYNFSLDAEWAGEYTDSSKTSQAYIVAPDEDSALISNLLTVCAQAHPEWDSLAFEMIDAVRSGADIKPTTRLAGQLGMRLADLADAMEQIKETMRMYVLSQMPTD